jgi:hypothetical protein
MIVSYTPAFVHDTCPGNSQTTGTFSQWTVSVRVRRAIVSARVAHLSHIVIRRLESDALDVCHEDAKTRRRKPIVNARTTALPKPGKAQCLSEIADREDGQKHAAEANLRAPRYRRKTETASGGPSPAQVTDPG